MRFATLIIVLLGGSLLWAGASLAQESPALPPGLGSPSLPSGLGSEPAQKSEAVQSSGNVDITGFAEVRAGGRLQSADGYSDWTLGEARAQVSLDWAGDYLHASLTTDFVFDPVVEEYGTDLGRGEGALDLREAWLLFRPSGNVDLKVGRQILTWGTGDLLFINDLFPKDWNAFFIGRDVEYLKAPSDAIKASWYSEKVSIDVVVAPEFDADRSLDGLRLTYFDPIMGAQSAIPNAITTRSEQGWEGALRAYGQAGSYEWAGYLYRGYWKSPAGYDVSLQEATYPRLNVYGASLRGPLSKGIANGEVGFYDSLQDSNGVDPFVPNSQWRLLFGYEQEVAPELTGGIQYYVELTDEYAAYQASLPVGMVPIEEFRQIVTVRLTQQLMGQNLTLTGFNFYSPSDEDGYLRLKAAYKISDAFLVEAGGNIFYGKVAQSFFGQFEDNSNFHVALRSSF